MELVTDNQLIAILGIDSEDDEELRHHKNVNFIQVCAGTWRRLDTNTWTFDKNPEWFD